MGPEPEKDEVPTSVLDKLDRIEKRLSKIETIAKSKKDWDNEIKNEIPDLLKDWDLEVSPTCNICGRVLDVAQDPSSRNCGGDCVRCMAESGDPDCIKTMEALKKTKGWVPKLGEWILMWNYVESIAVPFQFKDMDWATGMFVTKGDVRFYHAKPFPLQVERNRYKEVLEDIATKIGDPRDQKLYAQSVLQRALEL